MITRNRILFLLLVIAVSPVFSQDKPIRNSFTGTTASENKVTVMGAGFGAMPLASVSFGDIPKDFTFDGATDDGFGVVVKAKPGESAMILLNPIQTKQIAMLRCAVRTDSAEASIYLASIDQGPETFVSTITPNNGTFFLNKWRRLSNFFLPPSNGFQPLIQIINTSKTNPLTVYLDNFDVYLIDPARFYNGQFLDGDETDPAVISINAVNLPAATPTPIPKPVFTPTPNPGDPEQQIHTVNLNLSPSDKPLMMVLIPAGTFLMGSLNTEKDRNADEGPQHKVSISKSFYLGIYEITQAQWQAVMGNNPSYFNNSPNNPVENISWNDCQEFISKLNSMGEGIFRLPTEAEWEHACRAETTTRCYWGDDPNYTQSINYACYGSSGGKTAEVGTKLPNAWGLFDMSGNVWEWCQDIYGVYQSTSVTDPKGPTSGSFRVVRGGYGDIIEGYCRSAARYYFSPALRSTVGFRLLREYP